jgi:glutamate-ammonia-ligase adenylyltransferase
MRFRGDERVEERANTSMPPLIDPVSTPSNAASPLGDILAVCGPVTSPEAAARAYERLSESAEVAGWRGRLEASWPALEPVFAASPYLASLSVRSPERLRRTLSRPAGEQLERLLATASALGGDAELAPVGATLRRLKGDLHLLAALADLGGVWDVDQVTAALSRFADAAVSAALAAVARAEQAKGRLRASDDAERGPIPGFFCLALGKLGGFELNYSSDIDISIFYAPERLPTADGVDPQTQAVRLTRALAGLLQDRTAEGYVFRVDLRLRPDPSSTPPAMPVEAALTYYESAGQNWERAAMIKARALAGDAVEAGAFLDDLRPFIWRRSLDYAAIADIHAIKRQIHVHKVDERLSAPGHNLKLGAGGIREIEFFAQTQQLILGGRRSSLRTPRTVDALLALSEADQTPREVADELIAAYRDLRRLEHRVQMIADEQSHTLPQADEARRPVAALAGFSDLGAFDDMASSLFHRVNRRYGELFAQDEPLSAPFGSLVFTGVEDDPETLATLTRMGFSQPAQVSATIRAWHHGRIAATRTERGRELFTQLAPRLLEAAQASGAPDAAFNRFGDFFARLLSGVQVQSLFLAKPSLFQLVVQVMAFAPELARAMARQPGTLDAMLDQSFFAPIEARAIAAALNQAVDAADGFEAAMGAARRAHREQAFRIGVQVMSGSADAEQAGRAFAALADACIRALAPRALAETERVGGAFPGQVAVVALGKTGSREMTASSDLDLMTLYLSDAPDSVSATKGWAAEAFYARFTQRLITALSAPTGDGGLYTVDLQLRPSGRSGPVAVSLAAFDAYYAGEAETWEAMALSRGRAVWASSPAFGARAEAAIDAALRRPRDDVATAKDVRDMRALMLKERPPAGRWDLKLTPGGLVDIEFAAQFLQLRHGASGGPLYASTRRALEAMRDRALADRGALNALIEAWRLLQNLSQVLKLALGDADDPAAEPDPLRTLLARAGGAGDFADLEMKLAQAQKVAHAAFMIVTAMSDDPGADSARHVTPAVSPEPLE